VYKDIVVKRSKNISKVQVLVNHSKSDCIYHFPIDLEPNEILFVNQSENAKNSLISVDDKFRFYLPFSD